MTTATKIAYTITLTGEEYRTLAWLESRGYAADMIKEATEDTELEDGGHVLGYQESDAWNVHANAYPEDLQTENDSVLDEAFGACAGRTLLRKMFAFLDGIV